MSINNFSNRREARIIAFQSLFSYDFNPIPLEELISFYWLSDEDENIENEILDYASFLTKGTIENLSNIDEIIKNRLRNWNFDRISAIDKSILRFSIFSLLFEKDLDSKIIINEAIEIVKQFGTFDSYKFVNGLLDRVIDDSNSNNLINNTKKKKVVKLTKESKTKKEDKKIKIIKKI